LFFIVIILDIAFHAEVDQLTDRHAGIYADGLDTGDFQGPGIAKADVAFSGSGVDIDSEAANAGFPFQKRDGVMRLGVSSVTPR
jgi:hypothetical protein